MSDTKKKEELSEEDRARAEAHAAEIHEAVRGGDDARVVELWNAATRVSLEYSMHVLQLVAKSMVPALLRSAGLKMEDQTVCPRAPAPTPGL